MSDTAIEVSDDWPDEEPLSEREPQAESRGVRGADHDAVSARAVSPAAPSRSLNGSAPVPAATGSVPPQNLEAEESVLGAMMISANAIAAVSEIVGAADFYRESHAKIYRAALALYEKGEPVDAITLTHALDERGELDTVGGRVRLHELAALVPASGNADHYARIVRECATMRGLIRAGGEIARLGWGEQAGDPPSLVDRASEIVYELATGSQTAGLEHGSQAVRQTFDRIGAMFEAGSEMIGVATGFRDFDKLTSGLEPGNLIVLAARPSMGKSGLALAIAANLAGQRIPAAVFSLEMSKGEIVQRLLARQAHVDLRSIRTGKLAPDEWPRLSAAAGVLNDAPLYYRDTDVSLLSIRTELRRLKQQQPTLGLAVVDYLQLMAETAENRTQEVSKISRGLKLIARDLDLPILALSQLNRAVEARADKRPTLSDLRESGSIEQDADLVCFLYRDHYYNPETADKADAELIIAKHRNGPTGSCRLAFKSEWATFTDQHRMGMVG